ncbi:helix-turn-helix domain-containing protein [Terrarubrum flagellatum]|uniref:winged helix-turn-helix transcriptional regulator n=1 Tax=Terrirubrum flagellatum TaxID=2895980 RepID=UPI0031454A7C
MKQTNMDVPDHRSDNCKFVNSVLARIGDKWAVLVVRVLGFGSLRFSELQRKISGISQRMLTLTLRGLERDGLVKRTIFPTVPPRVDYELTPLGHSLLEPVRALGDWAFAHQAQIVAARETFDRAADETAAQKAKPPRITRRAA